MNSAHQHSVIKNAITAVATVAFIAYFTITLPPWSVTMAVPLHFIWAYSMILVGMWLPILIGVRANQRFLTEEEIEGNTPIAVTHAIDARVLQNTLEQTVFAAIATGLLVLSQAHHAAMLLLAHGAMFWVGRALFWIGYRYRPTMRGYGFGLTFYSSLGIFLYAVSFLLRALTAQ